MLLATCVVALTLCGYELEHVLFNFSADKTDPGLQYQNLSHMSRFSAAGFFTVTNAQAVNLADVMPPLTVTDLEMTSVEPGNKVVKLTWTAPGDDLDSGTGY